MDPRPALGVDIAWTMVSTAAVMAAMVFVNGVLARRGVLDPFTSVNLAKRIAGIAVPVVMLGLGVGVVRQISAAVDVAEQRRYRVAAVAAVLAVLAVGTGLVAALQVPLSRLSGLTRSGLLWGAWAYVAAMALNGLSYAFLRAGRRQSAANLVNLGANAVLPAIVVAFAPSSASGSSLLLAMSVPIVIWHGAELCAVLVRECRNVAWRLEELIASARSLFTYSLPRLPAALTGNAMLAAGPILLSDSRDASGLASLLAAMVVIQAAGAALQAVGIVVLPHAASLVPLGHEAELRKLAENLVVAALALASIAAPLSLAAAPSLVAVWLGARFVPGVPIVQVVLLAVPAVLFDVLLRSLVDAGVRTAWNTIAGVLGLATTVVLGLATRGFGPLWVAWAFAAGSWLQAGIVTAAVVVRYRPSLAARTWMTAALTAGMSAALGYVVCRTVANPVGALAGTAVVGGTALFFPFAPRSPIRRTLFHGQ